MVTFGIDKSCNVATIDQPILVVQTNHITDSVLQLIQPYTRYVRFTYEYGNKITENDTSKFNFDVSFSEWYKLCSGLQSLEFYGMLVDKQFTTKHLIKMESLQYLHIGATNYLLFNNEDISQLPKLNLQLNGFGVVQQSDKLEEWIDQLKSNNYTCRYYY